MGCNCGGNTRGGQTANEIIGYDYISPDQVSYFETNGAYLMTLQEARAEQRVHGGGSIRTIRASS